jgi:pimeloyl-ACP methyl ester carboxylesterase
VRGYVDTGWGQLHYESTGHGPRTIALFHETGLDYSAYQRLVPALSAHLRVVAFDTPGCGASDPPPGITTIEEYARHLVQGIDALGIDRLAVLGAHTGAQLAVQMGAGEIAHRIDAVFCLGLPFYRPEVLAARRVAERAPFAEDGSHLIAAWDRLPVAKVPEVRSRSVAATALIPDRVFWPYHSVYAYSPGKALPRITAPVVFLSCELDLLRQGDLDGVALAPHGTLITIPAERMPLYWTEPGRVAAEVLRTLGIT